MKTFLVERRGNDSQSRGITARRWLVPVIGVLAAGAAGSDASAQRARCAGPAAGPSRVAGAAIPAEQQIAAFDSAVTIVGRTYPDSTFRGLPWWSTADSLRKVVQTTPDAHTTRRAISTMLGLLGESHFGVFPASSRQNDASDPGLTLGLDVRVIEGVITISAVTGDGPAERAGVRRGARLIAVDGCAVDAALALTEPRTAMDSISAVRAMLSPRSPGPVRLQLDTGTRSPRLLELAVTPAAPTLRLASMGNLGFMPFAVRSRRVESESGSVGVITFATWVTPAMAPLDSAIDQLRDTDGMILDLRGNPGGVAGMVMGVGGHFIDSVVSLGTMTQRKATLRFVTNPRRVSTSGQRVTPYAGPLAILVDALSFSTSEFFAGGMQAVGRARVFGEQTGGMALPAIAERLPNDDVLYHVIADFVDAGRRRLEGKGVTPDTPVVVRRAALLAGGDPVYDAALAWLRDQPRRSTTGPTRNR
jgi:carboxyl-terminal processing protease